MRGRTADARSLGGIAPAVVGLIVLWIAALANQVWIFAFLFIGWALYDIVNGESHFVQRITRDDHPVLFWSVVVSWIAMSILWVAYA